ncbi:MAG TPA: NUDIX hydrolase [Acidimicrobiales bacterium]|nr:NUDIX hydrolase [Acidimicrobiales bacterium]
MPGFRKLAEQRVWEGHLIQVGTGTFESPSGDRFEREVVHHPGAVVVVPLHDDGRVTVVRQYRAAIDAELLEIPAGKRDVDGEEPEVTARRELAEEVGLVAGRMELMARFYNSPGFSDELTYIYLARDLEAVANDVQGFEEQHMTVSSVDLADVADLVRKGEIIDAKTIIGLSLARNIAG